MLQTSENKYRYLGMSILAISVHAPDLVSNLQQFRQYTENNAPRIQCFGSGFIVRIRIQHFRLNTNLDPDTIRIQGFDDQNWKKCS
jgi:hypothetical protein